MASIASFIYSQVVFQPQLPQKKFTGKTVILTGANAGLGLEACKHFLTLDCARLILAVRTPSKGESAKKIILDAVMKSDADVRVWPLDLGSVASVKAFAKRANEELDRVDVLVESAGIFPNSWNTTQDGWEAALQTNVISGALLAVLFMPKFRETAKRFHTQTSLVVVTSDLHDRAKFPQKSEARILEALNDQTKCDPYDRYHTTKLLEVLFYREFCSQIAGPSTEPVNPIITLPNPGLNDNATWNFDKDAYISIALFKVFVFLFARPLEKGARIFATAAAAGEEAHGSYMSDDKVVGPSPFVGTDLGAKVGRQVFAEIMDVLEGYVPGCTNLLRES